MILVCVFSPSLLGERRPNCEPYTTLVKLTHTNVHFLSVSLDLT